MRNLDSWLTRASNSAPAVMQPDPADRPPSTKRLRGLRAPGDYRTDDLIDEVRKNRVIWSRDARGFYSSAARGNAYKRVADALNRRFPELRPWDEEEVERHWMLLMSYHLACMRRHGPGGGAHSTTCHHERLSFLNLPLYLATPCRRPAAALPLPLGGTSAAGGRQIDKKFQFLPLCLPPSGSGSRQLLPLPLYLAIGLTHGH